MNTKYAALFQPYKIGNVQIQNRFAMAPMSLGFINTINGEYTEHGMEYMINRARGGFGLLFTGAFSCDYEVDPVNPLSGNPLNNPGAFIKQGKELTSRCNAFGTKVFGQITVGLGRNYPTYYGPSEEPVFGMPDVKSPELPVSGIKRKLELLADVAKIMQDAGFAGVEVHALHWGYLLDEFAMSMFNHRKDEYGGSLENRLRFAKEAVEAIKAKCGAAFPVTVRLGMKGYVKADYTASVDGSDEAGRTLEEAVEMAKLLERFGYDALSVDTGIYESFYYACPPCYVPRGYALEMAKRIKEAVNIPVLCGGRMGSADIALKAVEDPSGHSSCLSQSNTILSNRLLMSSCCLDLQSSALRPCALPHHFTKLNARMEDRVQQSFLRRAPRNEISCRDSQFLGPGDFLLHPLADPASDHPELVALLQPGQYHADAGLLLIRGRVQQESREVQVRAVGDEPQRGRQPARTLRNGYVPLIVLLRFFRRGRDATKRAAYEYLLRLLHVLHVIYSPLLSGPQAGASLRSRHRHYSAEAVQSVRR